MTIEPGPDSTLAKDELALRVQADNLREQAELLDFEADQLLRRLRRIGASSWYRGSLERGRIADRLMAEQREAHRAQRRALALSSKPKKERR